MKKLSKDFIIYSVKRLILASVFTASVSINHVASSLSSPYECAYPVANHFGHAIARARQPGSGGEEDVNCILNMSLGQLRNFAETLLFRRQYDDLKPVKKTENGLTLDCANYIHPFRGWAYLQNIKNWGGIYADAIPRMDALLGTLQRTLENDLVPREIERLLANKEYGSAHKLAMVFSYINNATVETVINNTRSYVTLLATEAKQLNRTVKLDAAYTIADQFPETERTNLRAIIDAAYTAATPKIDSTTPPDVAQRLAVLRGLAQRVVSNE